VVSLGRVLERAHLYERSDVLYRRALALADVPARVQALMRLALRARHAGDLTAARELWEQAAEAGEPEAFRALAVHHEHRTRDLGAALHAAESGMRLLDRTEARQRRLGDGFARRKERILRKMASEGGEAPRTVQEAVGDLS
jgi:TPR repeat protein